MKSTVHQLPFVGTERRASAASALKIGTETGEQYVVQDSLGGGFPITFTINRQQLLQVVEILSADDNAAYLANRLNKRFGHRREEIVELIRSALGETN